MRPLANTVPHGQLRHGSSQSIAPLPESGASSSLYTAAANVIPILVIVRSEEIVRYIRLENPASTSYNISNALKKSESTTQVHFHRTTPVLPVKVLSTLIRRPPAPRNPPSAATSLYYFCWTGKRRGNPPFPFYDEVLGLPSQIHRRVLHPLNTRTRPCKFFPNQRVP